MAIAIRSLGEHLAAEVVGIDLRQPVDDGQLKVIRGAFDEHSVLVFPGQALGDDEHVAFSARFGALETTVSSNPGGAGTAIAVFSNLDRDDQVIPPQDPRMVFNTGNQMWHTDSSFKPVPALASLLAGHRVPPEGGETEFASMRAAWEALPLACRLDLEGQICIHDFAWSRGLIDPNLLRDRDKQELPPVRQPLVRRNPVNGRRNLFLGAHASYIEGMALAAGRRLIADLNTHVTQPEFVYRHCWQRHDLVMWDNRTVLHRGRSWDPAFPRVMHRTTVAGTLPIQ